MNGERHYSPQPLDDELLYSLQRQECPRCGRTCRKPLIRVVCPVCAGVVTVNALDREGSTDSLCSKCEPPTTITIMTDDAGCITAIEGWPTQVEKKPKPSDWNMTIGLVLAGLVALWLIGSLLRPIVMSRFNEQATTGQQPAAGPASGKDESELASPTTRETVPVAATINGTTKGAGTDLAPVAKASPVMTPTRAPVTQDMFAPDQN